MLPVHYLQIGPQAETAQDKIPTFDSQNGSAPDNNIFVRVWFRG